MYFSLTYVPLLMRFNCLLFFFRAVRVLFVCVFLLLKVISVITHTSMELPPIAKPHKKEPISSSSSNEPVSLGLFTMLVTQDFVAEREDEVSLVQGDAVQVLTSNQQSMFLVHRPASCHCPAAEGWIPGYVLGHTRNFPSSNGPGTEEIMNDRKPTGPQFSLHPRKHGEQRKENGLSQLHECGTTNGRPLNPSRSESGFLDVLSDVLCAEGETATFHCHLAPPVTAPVSWKSPGQTILSSSDHYSISGSEDGMWTLKIHNVVPQDTGFYTCVASGKLGMITASAQLKIQGIPGRPVAREWTCTAVHLHWDAPLGPDTKSLSGYTMEYQKDGASVWHRSVTPTVDASLLLEGLQPGHAYVFRVIANYAWGLSSPSVTSEPLTLPSLPDRENGTKIVWKDKFDSIYKEVAEIGRGRFSVVKRCRRAGAQNDVAVKFVWKRLRKREDVSREASLLLSLKNPQLPRFHAAYETPAAFVLVLDLVEGEHVLDFLVKQGGLTEHKVSHFVQDTLNVLTYLHGLHVAHLDLKPESLLIHQNHRLPRVHFVGFGDASNQHGGQRPRQSLGSAEFSSPEVVRGETGTAPADVWSVGVLTYLMLSGVSPFLDESSDETCLNITRLDYSFPEEYFGLVSQAACSFIAMTLANSPNDRPSVHGCLQHPWLLPPGPTEGSGLNTSRLAAYIARRQQVVDRGARRTAKLLPRK